LNAIKPLSRNSRMLSKPMVQTTKTYGRSNDAVRESYQYVEVCLGRSE
jgi:hypothetical protein